MARVSQTKDFSIVIPSTSADEIGRLTHDFNDLLAELSNYDAYLKRAMVEVTAARDVAEEAAENIFRP